MYTSEHELQRLVHQIEDMVETVATDSRISSPDLRRILGFLAKVVQVVDQAFQDVYTTLIEVKYFTKEDLRLGREIDLMKQLDLIQARSRYRDAEEICSRLHHLRTQYETQIEPVIAHLGDRGRWWEVLRLIEEREGHIIRLVQESIYELRNILCQHRYNIVPKTPTEKCTTQVIQ